MKHESFYSNIIKNLISKFDKDTQIPLNITDEGCVISLNDNLVLTLKSGICTIYYKNLLISHFTSPFSRSLDSTLIKRNLEIQLRVNDLNELLEFKSKYMDTLDE